MAEHKCFFSTVDIAADLSISEEAAEGLVKDLHKELRAAGYLVVSGKVPSAWYKQQKANGFKKRYSDYIPLAERRLLSIRDFCGYVGGIDQRSARRFVKEKGFDVQIGTKMFVDRVRFDEWCTEQNCKGCGGNGPVDYGTAHIWTKSKKTGINRWELKIPYEANQGVTLKGDDIKENSIRKAPAMLQHGRA